jgi:hypothetical protein
MAQDDAGLECCHEGCTASVPSHRWGKIRAVGWLFTRPTSASPQGRQWCPDHLPEWVGPWRERQAAKKAKEAPND